MDTMKKIIRIGFRILVSAVFLVVMVFGFFGNSRVKAANTFTASLEVTCGQTEGRTILGMINELRTGGDAWCWNESNTSKINYGVLPALSYSYDLEKLAMQRAAEIAVSYSHTRPDGSDCWSVYTDYGMSSGWCGENIALGQSSATIVNSAWREDNELYEGQGHRRNMLNSHFTCVGIGHVVYNGVHYWVEEFGNTPDSQSYVAPNDGTASFDIRIDTTRYSNISLVVEETDIEIEVKHSVSVPEVFCEIENTMYWLDSTMLKVKEPTFNSGNTSVMVISDGQLVSKGEGQTQLAISAAGKSESIPVTVWNERIVQETDGRLTFHRNGEIDTSVNGLFSFDGKNYLMENGVVKTGTSGFVKIGEKNYYIDKGIWENTKNGFVNANGGKFYVSGGILVSSVNGLIQEGAGSPTWYFTAAGKVQEQKSGLVQYPAGSTNWFYVQNGKLDTQYSGMVTYNGGDFFVARGKILTAKQGLFQDPNNKNDWYFLANGQVQKQKTGIAIYNKAGFYVEKGKLNSNFTGKYTEKGVTYNVVNGRVV